MSDNLNCQQEIEKIFQAHLQIMEAKKRELERTIECIRSVLIRTNGKPDGNNVAEIVRMIQEAQKSDERIITHYLLSFLKDKQFIGGILLWVCHLFLCYNVMKKFVTFHIIHCYIIESAFRKEKGDRYEKQFATAAL